METTEKPEQNGGIINYFQGATIHNLVINGNMTKNGTENFFGESTQSSTPNYSDEQVARALANIVGKGKPIDAKKKWAGAIWLLQWLCNYPSNTKQACERIRQLPLPALEFECDYRNVRELATLSFLTEDPRHLDNVKYSKNDEGTFKEIKKVVIALGEELRKTLDYKACVNT